MSAIEQGPKVITLSLSGNTCRSNSGVDALQCRKRWSNRRVEMFQTLARPSTPTVMSRSPSGKTWTSATAASAELGPSNLRTPSPLRQSTAGSAPKKAATCAGRGTNSRTRCASTSGNLL